MTKYTYEGLFGTNLDEANAYTPGGVPGASDTADIDGFNASGNLSVDTIENGTITGTITANTAIDIDMAGGSLQATTVNDSSTTDDSASIDATTATGTLGAFGGSVVVTQDYTDTTDSEFGIGTSTGGSLEVDGDFTVDVPAADGAPRVDVSGGTLTVGGDMTLTGQAGSLVSFGVSNGGSITVSGKLTFQEVHGQIGTSGTVTADGQLVIDSNPFDVEGSQAVLTAKSSLTVGEAATAFLSVTAGGTVKSDGDLVIGDLASASGTIDVGNSNSQVIVGDASVTVGASGTGLLEVGTGAKFSAPDSDVTVGAEDTGNGTIEVSGSSTTFTADNVTVGSDHPGNLNSNGDVNGTDGVWTYTGGTGSLTVSNHASMTVGHTLTLDGEVNVAPDGILSIIGPIDIASGGSLAIGSTTAAPANSLAIAPGGKLIGHGAIESDVLAGLAQLGQSGTLTYSLNILNSGTIEAQDGYLLIQGNLSGDGVVQVDANSTLEIGGAVNAGTVITFAGDGPHTLILDDPEDFRGTISGLSVGDKIVLDNTSEANGNALVSATLGTPGGGSSGGQQQLLIHEGTDYDHQYTFSNGTPSLMIDVQGPNNAPIPISNDPSTSTSAEFFEVSSTANDLDTVLTLTDGNPVDLAVSGPTARASYGVTGAGIKIGIISDSFDALGGAADDVAQGALPAGVVDLADVPLTDEGRAMAQLIHTIAPGASIVFYSGDANLSSTVDGSQSIALAVEALQAEGCNVIVDDLGAPDEPDVGSSLENAINDAVASGVVYVTAAGNDRLNGIPIVGHSADPFAESVAAMNVLNAPDSTLLDDGYLDPATEPFSSIGANGIDPDITGPDGGATTLALGGLSPFFGTSAAAPVVAAVAALMLQENPQLESAPLVVDQLLNATALSLNEPSDEMGAGLVQANAAVAAAANAQTLLLNNASSAPKTTPVADSLLFSPGHGNITTGDVVEIVVGVSERVAVAGTPTLVLNDNGLAYYQPALSNPDAGRLVFDYTVGSGDITGDLEIVGVDLNGGSVVDAQNQQADFSPTFNIDSDLAVNSPLKVSTVSTLQTGEVQTGRTVNIVVTLNQALVLNASGGPPTLRLNNGGTATYDAGDSNLSAGKLAFDYTATTAGSTPDLTVMDLILPSGTTLRDTGGNNANLSGATYIATGLQIGAVTATDIYTGLTTARTGNEVKLTIETSAPVNVNTSGGLPTLALNDGGSATYDQTASEPGSDILVFDYNVGSDDQTVNLMATGLSNAAAITDAHGNEADLSGALQTGTGLSINSPFTAELVTSLQTGTITLGRTITLTLTMSEALASTVVAPTLTLNDGGTAYFSAQSSNSLSFTYTVAPGDHTSDLEVTQVNLNGGTLIDSSGYNADFSAALSKPTGIKVTASPTPSDFLGNGTSDVLYRGDASGDTGFYRVTSGANVGWVDIGASSTAYTIVGTGDFYGDGTTDILYRSAATGDTGFYQINNGANVGWRDVGASSTAYGVVGVGDFTGNGIDDILFRDNATGDTGFYTVSNGANVGWVDVGGSSTAYSVVGVGDFFGNGTDDILFRDNATGDTGFYTISNGVNAGWVDIGASSTAYSVVGVGDFLGNGTDDILFRDNATGDTGFYAVSNGVKTGWYDIGGSSTAYAVVAVGDYLGNGTSDILFRSNTTGDTGFYAISNGVNAGWHDIGASSTAYHVAS
jgi:hypothetical protein